MQKAEAVQGGVEDVKLLTRENAEKAIREVTSDDEMLLLEIEQNEPATDAEGLNQQQREALIDIVANELPGGYWSKRKSMLVEK